MLATILSAIVDNNEKEGKSEETEICCSKKTTVKPK